MSGLFKWRLRRTTLHACALSSVLCGIGIGKFSQISIVPTQMVIFSLLVCILTKRTIITVLAITCIGLSIGSQHGRNFSNTLVFYQQHYYKTITISVTASEDGSYSARSQLTFNADHVHTEDGSQQKGSIIVSGFGMNSVFQGDQIQVIGKLYPAYGAYEGRISYAKLILVAHHSSIISEIRRKFVSGVQSVLPEPEASFSMGLLIGQRSNLPVDTKQALLMVGLTHIIAVSGYNLTILLQASRRLLQSRSKHIALAFSICLIGTFLLITGLSASIVRAAIVSTLSIFAAYYGRTFRPVNLILIAAVITAWANPVYVWSDVSWYLSFLAFFGVLIVAPLILTRLPNPLRQSLLIAIAVESFCAEVMTLPFVLFIFGQFSLVGLLANVLVVSLVPLAMLLSTIAGLAGMATGLYAGWFGWPAEIITSYMLTIARLLSRVHHGFVEGIKISAVTMVLFYGFILLGVVVLRFNTHGKSDIVTDEVEVYTKGVRT